MSFHGGFLGVVLAAYLFARRYKLPALHLGDLVACAAPVGLLLGRIANFINGELWGRASDVPWAMVFPGDRLQVARHPSQLYEALLEGLVLFIVLFIASRKESVRRKYGLLMGIFMAGYGLSRFIVEFAREPDAHLGAIVAGATMGQLLSIPMILVGLFLIWRARNA